MLPVYVDLDGTLHPGDTLWDAVAIAVRRQPWSIWRIAVALLQGPVAAKRGLADLGLPDPSLLPYRTSLLDWLRAERAAGRRIVLATAAHQHMAEAVAAHLGCFDAVIATGDDGINRKGAAKLAAIQADARGPFCYAGDATADLPIWRASAGAVLVGPAANWPDARVPAPVLARHANAVPRWRALLRALRPQQWVKNLLVFVPMLAAHVHDADAWLAAAGIFAAFCACASSVYLLNDLLDLENDRAHARKRLRPFAAGSLPIPLGMLLAPLLLFWAANLTWTCAPGAALPLAVYYAATVAYSFDLKRRVLVDVFALAGLYVLRAVAGAMAVAVPLSPWLMAVLVFLFLSLALGKRASELHSLRVQGRAEARGRGWRVDDLPFVTAGGIAAAFATALVVGLYIASSTAPGLYSRPVLLWGLVPLILWWSCRIWLTAGRGELQEDPISFAIKDRGTWGMVALAALCILAAGPKGAA
jgi:4-hydroxybenzoate polyprenyltransferase